MEFRNNNQNLLFLWSCLVAIMISSTFHPIYADESSSGTELLEGENKANHGWRKWFNRVEADEPKEKEVDKVITIFKNEDRDEWEPAYDNNEKSYLVTEIQFRGDVERFSSFKPLNMTLFDTGKKTIFKSLHDEITNAFHGKELSEREIEEICATYSKALINLGYLLVYIEPDTKKIAKGILNLNIHLGRFGEVLFFEWRDEQEYPNQERKRGPSEIDRESLLPYEGRYFSKDQIRKRLSFNEDDIFNYKQLYQNVFSLNRHSDLNLNTLLRIQTDNMEEERDLSLSVFTQNIVNIDFLVSESLPLHGALQVDNTGTDDTRDWRARASIQYSNFTKFSRQFDILTLDLTAALDGSLYGATGTYTYPNPLSFLSAIPPHSFNILGGWFELEVDDIVINLDDEGDGWFAGTLLKFEFLNSSDFSLDLTLGITHRFSESQTISNGRSFDVREISITPLSIGLTFTNRNEDLFKGRNFVTYSYYHHSGGFLGSDDDDEFNNFRVGANSDYQLSRFQFIRIQQLFDYHGDWRLYLKADAQYTDDQLVSLEQKALGGLNTVRGFPEREILGDKGISTTIELRTPRFDIPSFEVENQNQMITGIASTLDTIHLSFLTFFDYGHSRINDALPGEEERIDLSSVGVGLRLNISDYFNVSFDYGFTLKDLPNDENDDGRGHLVVRYQF